MAVVSGRRSVAFYMNEAGCFVYFARRALEGEPVVSRSFASGNVVRFFCAGTMQRRAFGERCATFRLPRGALWSARGNERSEATPLCYWEITTEGRQLPIWQKNKIKPGNKNQEGITENGFQHSISDIQCPMLKGRGGMLRGFCCHSYIELIHLPHEVAGVWGRRNLGIGGSLSDNAPHCRLRRAGNRIFAADNGDHCRTGSRGSSVQALV